MPKTFTNDELRETLEKISERLFKIPGYTSKKVFTSLSKFLDKWEIEYTTKHFWKISIIYISSHELFIQDYSKKIFFLDMDGFYQDLRELDSSIYYSKEKLKEIEENTIDSLGIDLTSCFYYQYYDELDAVYFDFEGLRVKFNKHIQIPLSLHLKFLKFIDDVKQNGLAPITIDIIDIKKNYAELILDNEIPLFIDWQCDNLFHFSLYKIDSKKFKVNNFGYTFDQNIQNYVYEDIFGGYGDSFNELGEDLRENPAKLTFIDPNNRLMGTINKFKIKDYSQRDILLCKKHSLIGISNDRYFKDYVKYSDFPMPNFIDDFSWGALRTNIENMLFKN